MGARRSSFVARSQTDKPTSGSNPPTPRELGKKADLGEARNLSGAITMEENGEAFRTAAGRQGRTRGGLSGPDGLNSTTEESRGEGERGPY